MSGRDPSSPKSPAAGPPTPLASSAFESRARHTPRPADPRQVRNAAGGHGFAVDRATRLQRFLTLGVEGGTYDAAERELTATSAQVVLDACVEDGLDLVERIVAVSTAGRAPRQNPAIFALAAASALSDDAGRRAALDALPRVCRTGTHLFLFATYVEQFRGWGRGLRRAVGDWYRSRDADALAYQVVKYRQRHGWTHRDLLRLAHPEIEDPASRALVRWVLGGEPDEAAPALVHAFEHAQRATAWTDLVAEQPLSWEMLPDRALGEPDVWRALVARGLPQTALIRQLPRLTRLGVLTGETLQTVVRQLTDPERLRRARVHPVHLLVALRTYMAGQGVRGSATWEPVTAVVDALDAAFYAAFGTVEPAGRRTLVALDVSGSMAWPVSGLPLSCREASAALALVTLATEPQAEVVGFASSAESNGTGFGLPREFGLVTLPISPPQRLDDVVSRVSMLPFGGTDCALPMTWALERGREFDTFVVLTDSETWAGAIHPHQALQRYRERTGIDARLVVVGMTATDVSIADPTDPRMLDVAGFDAAAPQLVADFSRGSL